MYGSARNHALAILQARCYLHSLAVARAYGHGLLAVAILIQLHIYEIYALLLGQCLDRQAQHTLALGCQQPHLCERSRNHIGGVVKREGDGNICRRVIGIAAVCNHASVHIRKAVDTLA